jgi:DNA-binding MarR family transcriptional regulator
MEGHVNPPLLSAHLCFNLYATSLRLTQLYKPMLAPLGLSYPQYLVMLVLWESDGLKIGDIAKRLQQGTGSVTPLVKRLERLGYLVRKHDQRDQRNRRAFLTDRGCRLRASAGEVSERISRACKLEPQEFDALMVRVRALSAALAV